MTDILLLDTVEKTWNYLGFNLKKSMRFLNKVYIIIAFLTIFTVTVLGFMIMFTDDLNLNALADVFESCGPNYQLLSKIIINGLSVGTIKNLLLLMEEKLWPIDKFGENMRDKLLKYVNVVRHTYKIYCYIMCSCGIIICMRPVFLEYRRYPLASYNIVDASYTPFYFTMYCFHLFDFIYGISMFLAVDGLFALFVLNIVCQVKMLKHGFKSLEMYNITNDREEDECYRNIKEYVDHHNFILDAEISSQIRSGLILATFINEMAIYCIGGTFLTEVGLQLADSMYMSGWETTKRKRLQFAVHMIIMRSQKAWSIRAGGLFDINVVTLVSILQSSFSFYTLMNNVESSNKIDK